MTLERGEIHTPGSVGEIRDDILTDQALIYKDSTGSEPAVQPGTDNYMWAQAHAGALIMLHANVALRDAAHNPLLAEGEELEAQRVALQLPEVLPSPSTGRLVIGASGGAGSFAGGEEFLLPNGKRGKVRGSWPAVTTGGEIDVITIDTGSDTQLGPGEKVTFVNAPLNIDTEATVSSSVPLSGGTDEESDERKQTRILNRLRNPPGGGNWSQKRGDALDALSSLQDCYVYPALGGPASEKLALIKAMDPENSDYSRQLTTAARDLVAAFIWAAHSSPMEIVVQSVADEAVDVAISATLPDSVQIGGNGRGWLDAAPWPALEVADGGRATVSAVTSPTVITVGANTTTAPVAGQTRVAWWSPNDRRFYTALVTTQIGATTAWVLTLDKPLTDSLGSSVTVGDFISPAAVSIEDYGDSWITVMNKLGAGENTSNAARLPRAKRHPYVEKESSGALNFSTLSALKNRHPEISEMAFGYRSLSAPTVPASVKTAPNVLVPRHFGIYKQ